MKAWLRKTWFAIKGLFFDDARTGPLSLGRVAFWILFVLAFVRWLAGAEIPSGMLTALLSLTAYGAAKHVRGALETWLKPKPTGEPPEVGP